MQDHPIFWEFVQYITSNTRNLYADEHWRPINRHCSFCTVNYDFIIKFENFEEEGNYLKSRLAENLNDFWTHEEAEDGLSLKDAFPSLLSSRELTEKYFEMYLSSEDVRNLFEAYKEDFLMFGYSFTFKGEHFPGRNDIMLH